MKRKLLLLNALLAGLLILGGAELYSRWLQAEARYATLEKYADDIDAPGYPPVSEKPAVRPAAYMPIVERLLFSKDRNSLIEVAVEEAQVEQRPGLPLFSGLVDFGDGPLALMAAGAGGEASWIAIGERVGEYTFKGLAEDGRVKLAWKDQELTVAQSELTGEENPQPSPNRPPTAALLGRGPDRPPRPQRPPPPAPI
jgi:hypothetical protein